MVSRDYASITSIEQLRAISSRLLDEGKPVGFDLETGYYGTDFKKRSVDHYNENQFVVGFSFTNDATWARYVPLMHDSGGNIDATPYEVWEVMRPLLENGDIVAHNAKFERAAVWKAAGIVLGKNGSLTDTMLDTAILALARTGSWRTMIALKDVVYEFFDHQMMHIEELWPDMPANKMSFLRFNTLPVNTTVVSYACEDAAWVLPLREKVTVLALKERRFMHDLEHVVMEMMEEVERFGVHVDWEGIKTAYTQAQNFVPLMEQHVKVELGKVAGRDLSELNLNSTQQMKRLLFKEIGMHTTRLTKKGQEDGSGMDDWEKMSTDKKALVALADEYDAVKQLLEFREVKNLTNRLKKWLTEYTQSYDKRVHANYKQAGAEGDEASAPGSGRFSASDPAIQQLPKKWKWVINADGAENGKDFWSGNFRNFIMATPKGTPTYEWDFRLGAPQETGTSEGTYLLTFDYSQVELRMLAGASQEPTLLEAFRNEDDVHTLTAAMMLGKNPHDINPETERPIGKAQPVTSLVLTPAGWRKFGDLVVGDEVTGSNGLPTKVTGVFPQGVKRVFEVTTSDGAKTQCCEEHLWTVSNVNSKNQMLRTKELRQIVSSGLKNTSGQPKYVLPKRPVVEYAPLEDALPIDPYMLGLLLGDGGFTHSWAASYGSANKELFDAVQTYHEMRGGKVAWKSQGEDFWVGYLASGLKYRPNYLTAALKELGLWGLKSNTTFVPTNYLRASPSQRLALLQGLLDTDGSVQHSGANFRVTSLSLAQAVQELARSLGGQATLSVIKSHTEGLPQWRVQLTLPAQFEPFRLQRKIAKRKPVTRSLRQRIVAVKEVMPSEVKCISVQSTDGLYVSSDYIVTHNTFNFA